MKNIPLIERTIPCRTPSGRRVSVNRFSYNLAMASGGGYIQLTDTSWIRADALLVGPVS